MGPIRGSGSMEQFKMFRARVAGNGCATESQRASRPWTKDTSRAIRRRAVADTKGNMRKGGLKLQRARLGPGHQRKGARVRIV